MTINLLLVRLSFPLAVMLSDGVLMMRELVPLEESLSVPPLMLMAELLVSHGADCRARNRRGAEPLHYAADGGRREPRAQADVIAYLISIGAKPNAVDKTGDPPGMAGAVAMVSAV